METADEKVAWLVVVGDGPGSDRRRRSARTLIAEHLGEPWQIAILLAVFGVLLWVADRTPERRTIAGLGFGAAVLVGFAQALALMPGVSRSGITITAARFLGLTREAAARFSFFLLVPIVLGAVLLKGWTGRRPGRSASGVGGAVRGRARSPRPRPASPPSRCCSATSRVTTTPCSSCTGSSSPP